MATVYIDDKGTSEIPARPPVLNETTLSSYYTTLLTVAAGYYMNLEKSIFLPTKDMLFLGFRFQTDLCRISVPDQKYQKLCTEILSFIQYDSDFFDLGELQHIRV